ncbi:hypothetical protein [Planococcus sp. ISL-109]|uniref:hypothetical protein n=1 Tax=Planococcus sp. ISL-109 TaxID=2819166 RepID=UPI001BEC1E08|nr:hypothetical protein [Planococcus sp. ISL-109]MBT2581218.1 hypothetical protein [Planococcus sp. ISL-109]
MNNVKESTVMDHTRMKVNKTHLFHTPREAAVENQLIAPDPNRLNNKMSVHFAAKAIADRKQAKNGGQNESNNMVRRYKRRTTTAMKQIIAEVQKMHSHNV